MHTAHNPLEALNPGLRNAYIQATNRQKNKLTAQCDTQRAKRPRFNASRQPAITPHQRHAKLSCWIRDY